MSSHLSSDGHDIQPGDRVIDLESPIDRTTPDGTLQSLGFFLQHLDPLPAIELTDTDVLGALPLLETNSSELGVIVYWHALEQCRLLEHIDGPESIAVGVLQHQIPITVRPLSQLRSSSVEVTAGSWILGLKRCKLVAKGLRRRLIRSHRFSFGRSITK